MRKPESKTLLIRSTHLWKRVQQLNADIVRLTHSGVATTELEDKRDAELEKIAKYINIKTFTRSEGDVVIYTGNGVTCFVGPGGHAAVFRCGQ